MRYRLRTLLIAVACLLPVVAAACFWQEAVAVVSFLVNGE